MTKPRIRELWEKEVDKLTEQQNCCDGMNDDCCGGGWEKIPSRESADWWLSKFTTDLDELAGKLRESKSPKLGTDQFGTELYPDKTSIIKNTAIDHALSLIKNLRERYAS